MSADHATPPSPRTRLRRYHSLARYDREAIDAIIDAGIAYQVGYVVDGRPYVTPTSHWRIDDFVYWHGSSASRMLKAQSAGIPVSFSVTHLDGLVFARAAFNHNLNYRSMMAFGEAELTATVLGFVTLAGIMSWLQWNILPRAGPPKAYFASYSA